MPLVASDLRLAIFDCDGVLVDSEPLSARVLADKLTAAGLATTPEQARRDYQGLLLTEVRALAESRLGRALNDAWLAEFERDRAEVFRRELREVPGAGAAVGAVLTAGLDVCVASQGKLEKTRLSLDLTGLRRLFADEALFSAWTVPRGKPHPDLFLHAAASFGVQPGACVVVEDSPSGVTAAVAAGMRVLGYAADVDGRALRAAGAQTFGSLAELPGLLGIGLRRASSG
jgi:beta-phosphoglucomutase-like phosphatase (HAD superfamily)